MSEVKLQVSNLLNYSQAARILRVTRVTIYAMIERGELHPLAIADRRYLIREEVERIKNEKATGDTREVQMEDKKDLIGIEDAQRAAERFILARHSKAKVDFDQATLKQIGEEPVYEVEGSFAMSGGFFSSGAKKVFQIQVHAYSTKIVGYKM